MAQEIGATAGRINGAYGEADWTPIRYVNRAYSRATLAGLYRGARVGLVTPLRDGMNLVAKEYVASRPDLGGVLVLSEFTGAAAELKDALLINPHDIDGLKAAIKTAFTMPRTESSKRMRSLRRQVLTHDVDRWAHSFLDALGLPE
jgi:trehalose 6-phosphate synthase